MTILFAQIVILKGRTDGRTTRGNLGSILYLMRTRFPVGELEADAG